jgi:hypothetical protein
MLRRAMDERAAVDELFSARLDAFVETRARLAGALAAAGHKAEAQALKKLRRPSASAWATNQVVRRARGEVDAFLAASDRLRGSQGAIVAGRGDRGVYQADVEELRRATGLLAAATRRLLEEAGRGEDRALVDAVVANARAAALTDAGRQALLDGALAADLAGDVDAFGGLLVAGGAAAEPAAPPRPAKAAEAPRPAPGPSAREDAEALRRREERERALEAARREEGDARAGAAAAEAALARARGEVEAARARVDEAQRAARDAEAALREADARQRAAQREATEAETRAGRATRRREALEK